MPIYVILRDLVRGRGERRTVLPAGGKTRLEWLDPETQQILVRRGAVREIESPPLSELRGWTARARRLSPHGVETLDDMLEADAGELAEALNLKPATVEKWQDSLKAWANEPGPARRSG